MEDKIYVFIKENITKPIALIIGIVFLVIILFLPLDNFLSSFITNAYYRLPIHLVLLVVWIVFWVIFRNYLPKNKKDFVGLVIAIRTENDKQKIRLKNDFVRKINELITSKKLSNIINVIQLNQLQSSKLINCLEKGLTNKNHEWIKIEKKINGHFYIFGDIKERSDFENKYFLSLEALVRHAPLRPEIQQRIRIDFINIWAKKINFLEKLEFRGFEFSAEMVLLAALYITGLAALYSRDPFLALELHKDLNKEFERFKPIPPHLKKVKNKVSILLSEESFLIARWYYEQKGDLINTELFLKNSLEYHKQNYGGLLLKAIVEFLNYRDPRKALETIKVSKQYSGNDGTWRYSEAFLLMYLEQYENAYSAYKKITKKSYIGESESLQQVYKFNLQFLKENPDKIQSLFILGYLKYKKEENFPEALQYFEQFLEKSKGKYKFVFLNKRAQSYSDEIKRFMEIEK